MRSESALPGRAEPWRQHYACRHFARGLPEDGGISRDGQMRVGATIWRLVTYVFSSRGSWLPGRSDGGICRTDRSPCAARACCIRSPRSVLMNDLPTRPIDGLWVRGIRNLRDDRIPPITEGRALCTAPWTTRSVHMRHQLLPRGHSEASPNSSVLVTRRVNTRFETPAVGVPFFSLRKNKLSSNDG